MTEYLSKKAVLEWLDEKIISVRGLAIGFRNQGDELGERDCRHDADVLSIIKSKIQSGAFDADESEGTWKATAEVLGRENIQMNSEIQRLRAAAIKLHETLNTFWQNDCDKADVVAAQSNLCDVLSTTTEPTEGERIRNEIKDLLESWDFRAIAAELESGYDRGVLLELLELCEKLTGAKSPRANTPEGDGNDA